MILIPDDPEITSVIRTGYPSWLQERYEDDEEHDYDEFPDEDEGDAEDE